MVPVDGTRSSRTESVCPVCLARIPAIKRALGQDLYLNKTCPEHGEFSAILWKGEPSAASWGRPKIPCRPGGEGAATNKGCPFDCGLCPEHRQQTCTAVLEITHSCDLRCPYCFADAGDGNCSDPDLSLIKLWYEALLASGNPCNIQLSGGEPSLRDDLPEIVSMGRDKGFSFIQLNTNGLRLARDPSFVERLKQAGLASVFLQFDGTEDEIYRELRGLPLLRTKLKAIRNCEQHGLGVVLVPTVVPGVNTHNIGEITRFALENISVVRGVHFQPVSYFGRYPQPPSDADRLTLPELIRLLEAQTSGLIKAGNFKPPGCENAMCSFHGNFVLMPDGALVALTRHQPADSCCGPASVAEGASMTRAFVAEHWAAAKKCKCESEGGQFSLGQWDVLLERSQTHMLCVSAMAFQDAWNLDLDRLRDCCIHAVARDGKLIPFCAYNLTDSQGGSLYRSRC